MLVEAPIVSERGFGGTIDLYASIDGEPTLVDFKTGRGLYPEMVYQLAAYQQLIVEAGYLFGQARLLRIGRNADEGFEEKVVRDLAREWDIFCHCLAIYKLQHVKEAK